MHNKQQQKEVDLKRHTDKATQDTKNKDKQIHLKSRYKYNPIQIGETANDELPITEKNAVEWKVAHSHQGVGLRYILWPNHRLMLFCCSKYKA